MYTASAKKKKKKVAAYIFRFAILDVQFGIESFPQTL